MALAPPFPGVGRPNGDCRPGAVLTSTDILFRLEPRELDREDGRSFPLPRVSPGCGLAGCDPLSSTPAGGAAGGGLALRSAFGDADGDARGAPRSEPAGATPPPAPTRSAGADAPAAREPPDPRTLTRDAVGCRAGSSSTGGSAAPVSNAAASAIVCSHAWSLLRCSAAMLAVSSFSRRSSSCSPRNHATAQCKVFLP